ncbi:phage terminase small subunit P27 family [Marinifilum flexuosum]|uniref:P27 family predicted phage terminase small subunit n=1 Tax=Marinifilum flexuosum TaxID=1117708 RepID=A0A419WMQ3_9BACT|nr:phage terminase small subunit P27 family [Marinifilum flexuosum]RKD96763.1 P27 family predicted phage terminase small subunit [Marinifilum flexuosum]
MTGRKPQPTKMKVLKGTDRKDRLNQNEPVTEPVAKMKPPAYLNNTAKTAFRELVKLVGADGMNVLAESDRAALGMLCDQYSIYREARNEVRKLGLTFESKGRNGKQIKARPEVQIMNNAWDRVAKMLVEFGCTPSARSRVNELEKQEKDAFEDFLNDNKKSS